MKYNPKKPKHYATKPIEQAKKRKAFEIRGDNLHMDKRHQTDEQGPGSCRQGNP